MKPKIDIETSIPSYLTAWTSRDLVMAARQQITREWWEQRSRFDLYISQVVLREASRGDQGAADRRVKAIQGLPVLELTPVASQLAQALVRDGPLPPKAAVDALHIAVAVASAMDFLLTWNCTHIANAAMRGRIESLSRFFGYEPPVICTPEELMEI